MIKVPMIKISKEIMIGISNGILNGISSGIFIRQDGCGVTGGETNAAGFVLLRTELILFWRKVCRRTDMESGGRRRNFFDTSSTC